MLSDRDCTKKFVLSKISLRDSKVCLLPSPLPTDIFIGESLDLRPKTGWRNL